MEISNKTGESIGEWDTQCSYYRDTALRNKEENVTILGYLEKFKGSYLHPKILFKYTKGLIPIPFFNICHLS